MLNEPASFNLSTSARYARKYGSKTNNSVVVTTPSNGSHTSRILHKSKKVIDSMSTSFDKSGNDNSIMDNSLADFQDTEKSSRNYRIKIKRPKSAFFTSSSSNAISKPGNSPSPQPVIRSRNIDHSATTHNAYISTSINPYSYLKNSYKKNMDRSHYFYTKEEMSDYQDQVALNQLFMSKTCQSFNNCENNTKLTGFSPNTPNLTPPTTKSSSQSKSSKMNRYSSSKTNFLFSKPR